MEIIGLICEYNPFHNGHLYHIKKIKEMFPDSLLILVLNGYFLERGEISILTKEDKVKLSLEYGIDIVLELPVLFGTQSADIFASTALTILNCFGVEKLVFGSELHNMNALTEIVESIENPLYNEKVKTFLKTGMNYPTALAKAISSPYDFNNPNDLLAISYIKTIRKETFPIESISIKRTNDYHDLESTDTVISASNIRTRWKNEEDITKYLPKDSKDALLKENDEIFFKLLKAKILTTPHLDSFLTVDEGIESRLVDMMKKSITMEEFQNNVKTKRYTYNKIRRMCVHLLLGITKEDNKKATLAYIKVLGFSKKGQNYLKTVKKTNPLPITVDKNSLQYKTEIKASLVYDLIMGTNTYVFEKHNFPIKKL